MVRTDDLLCQEILHRLDEYAGGVRRWTASVADGVATVDGGFDDHTERLVVSILGAYRAWCRRGSPVGIRAANAGGHVRVTSPAAPLAGS